MAEKDRMAVLAAMMEQSIIPVFYDPDVEVCRNVIQACANGGAKCVEFTNRGDFAAHVVLRGRRATSPRRTRSVIMGVGSIVDAPTAGIYIANGAQIRRRSVAQRGGCQGLQPSRHALQPGLRLRDRDRRCAGTRLRDRQDLPGRLRGRPGVRQERAGPDALDPHHADRRRRSDRGVAAQVVRRWHRRLRHRQQPDHQATCSSRSDYAGVEARVRETIGLAKKIKAELARVRTRKRGRKT